jgi:O-antigen/teichoic acid export membrane protein
VGVILVGSLAGPAAAGLYAAASRFAGSGMIVDAAIRVTVSPLFSRLIHRRADAELEDVYSKATCWLVLFSAPVFMMMAVFSPLALSLLGHGFVAAGNVLVIMCTGAMITLLAGNIHSVLLMSGRSGLAATNKAIVVAVNVLLILVLTPLWGIEGAALGWAIACLLDAMLAWAEVRILLGIRVGLSAGLPPLLGTLITIGIPSVLARWLLGPTYAGLGLALAVGAALFVAWCLLDRNRLRLALRADGKKGKDHEA